MRKHMLFAAVAAAALAYAGPAIAQDSPGGADGDSSLEVDLRYANNIDTSVVTDVTYTKDVLLTGTVTITGTAEIDSSAVAVNDVKQILSGSAVTYREENELNGENGYVSPIFGPGWSEPGFTPGNNPQAVAEPQIRAGYFAPIINTVASFDVGGSGNIGVNIATGYFNMQMNSASMAVSTSDSPNEDDGGWAEASATSLQSILGVFHGRADDPLEEDSEDAGGGGNNFRDRNTVVTGAIGGAGNIGVNAAAGAFNQQANLMTLAVANDSSLAEANSGLVQNALLAFAEQQDSINVVDAGALGNGASGNLGVNLASGVGNQQLNSLTIATSSGGGDGSGGGGLPDDPS